MSTELLSTDDDRRGAPADGGSVYHTTHKYQGAIDLALRLIGVGHGGETTPEQVRAWTEDELYDWLDTEYDAAWNGHSWSPEEDSTDGTPPGETADGGSVAHTPGPWVAHISRRPGAGHEIDAPASGHVVVLGSSTEDGVGVIGRTPEEAAANARLIAALPDLLAENERVRTKATALLHAVHAETEDRKTNPEAPADCIYSATYAACVSLAIELAQRPGAVEADIERLAKERDESARLRSERDQFETLYNKAAQMCEVSTEMLALIARSDAGITLTSNDHARFEELRAHGERLADELDALDPDLPSALDSASTTPRVERDSPETP